MKKQNSKIDKTKIITRVIIAILLIANMLSLTSCMWGPTIAYNWKVETHNEFVKEIEKYNSIHDEFINTFISFDLDNNENISNRMYRFSTIANKSAVHKYGLCDKVGRTFNVEFACHLRLNVENNDYPYQIGCYYRDTQYNFSEKDKIEIKKGNPYDGKDLSSQCNHMSKDRKYTEKIFSDLYIYNIIYHYELFVNDTKFACIHISSVEEVSEEKLDEIIQMLLDSMVILNTED